MIGLNGRRGQLSSLIGCTVSLHHVRYLQLPIFENVYSILIFLAFRFQNRRYCVPSQTVGYLHFLFVVELTLFRILYVGNYFEKKDLHISLKYATTISGVPRNFFGGVQQIQLRTERTGIWGQQPPSQGFWSQL
jgi:hypothetical protein